MNGLLWNFLLTLAWISLTGDWSPENFALGFILGMAILYFTSRTFSTASYFERLWRAVGLAIFFLWQLILSNVEVAYDVITPGHRMRPAVLAVPLTVHTDAQITLLCNLVTLTPGTISLDISADRRVLYIHAMYVHDPEEARRRIKDGFERRILEVLS